MSKILCPVDFSESSMNAAKYAANLCSILDTELVLLHVEPAYMMVLKEGDDQGAVKGGIEVRLEEMVYNLKAKNNIEASYRFEFADLLTDIKEITTSSEFGIIVMGTEGMANIQAFHLGSTTAQVVHNTRCSLISVPDGFTYKKPEHVVFAVDNPGEGHSKVLDVIIFARTFGADITVLHVDRFGEKDRIDTAFKEELLGSLDFPNWIKFEELPHGDVCTTVIDYMHEKEGSILVTMTHDLDDYLDIFHQSVTKELVENADFPVLVFHV